MKRKRERNRTSYLLKLLFVLVLQQRKTLLKVLFLSFCFLRVISVTLFSLPSVFCSVCAPLDPTFQQSSLLPSNKQKITFNNALFFQFFVTSRSNLSHLNNDYVVFGEVSEGFDVIAKINNVLCDDGGCPLGFFSFVFVYL